MVHIAHLLLDIPIHLEIALLVVALLQRHTSGIAHLLLFYSSRSLYLIVALPPVLDGHALALLLLFLMVSGLTAMRLTSRWWDRLSRCICNATPLRCSFCAFSIISMRWVSALPHADGVLELF